MRRISKIMLTFAEKYRRDSKMPRKTNGMKFELHPRPTLGDDGPPLLYTRPAKDNKRTMQEVDDFCAENRGLRRGEVTRAFNCFIDVCSVWLAEVCRIETPLGVFSPKLRLLGDHTDPQRVTTLATSALQASTSRLPTDSSTA